MSTISTDAIKRLMMKNAGMATDEPIEQIQVQIGLAVDDLMNDHVQDNLHRLGILGADSVYSAIARLTKLLVDGSEAQTAAGE